MENIIEAQKTTKESVAIVSFENQTCGSGWCCVVPVSHALCTEHLALMKNQHDHSPSSHATSSHVAAMSYLYSLQVAVKALHCRFMTCQFDRASLFFHSSSPRLPSLSLSSPLLPPPLFFSPLLVPQSICIYTLE